MHMSVSTVEIFIYVTMILLYLWNVISPLRIFSLLNQS